MIRIDAEALLPGVLPEPTRGLTREEVAVVLGKPGKPLTTRRVYHLLKVGIHRKGWKEPVKLGAQQMTWGEMVFAHHIQAFWDALADARSKAAGATPRQREKARQDNRAPRETGATKPTYPMGRTRFGRHAWMAPAVAPGMAGRASGTDAPHTDARPVDAETAETHKTLDAGGHEHAGCERAHMS